MEDRRAAVLTVSDSVSAGERTDGSGPAVMAMLAAADFVVTIHVVPDDRRTIEDTLHDLAVANRLVVTTGGTGFGPRDVTPEATRAQIDREAPGFAEAMRAAGRAKTPFADMSRGVVGTIGKALVINLPGSPKGATESLEAVLPLIDHALEHLGGATEHA